MTGHLDEGTIHAWLDGALAPDESTRVERHAASCDACGALVAEARGLAAASSRILSALDGVPGDVIPGQAPHRDQLAALRARRGAARPPWWRRREFLAAASLLFVAGTGTAVYRALGDRAVSGQAALTEAVRIGDSAGPREAGGTSATGAAPAGAPGPAPEIRPTVSPDRQQKAAAAADPIPLRGASDLAANQVVGAVGLAPDSPRAADSLRTAASMAVGVAREEAREARLAPQPATPPAAVTTQASVEAQAARTLQAQSGALPGAPMQRLANEADFAGKGVSGGSGLLECYELRPADPAGLRSRGVPERVRIATVTGPGNATTPALQALAESAAPGTTLTARQLGDVVELLVRRGGDSTRVRFQRSATEAPAPPVSPGTYSLSARRIRCGM